MTDTQPTVPDLLGDETCEECESTGVNCDLHWENAARQEELDEAAETPEQSAEVVGANLRAMGSAGLGPAPTTEDRDGMSRHTTEAAGLLVHYLRAAYQAAGLPWGSDNTAEVQAIVDGLAADAREAAEAAVTRHVYNSPHLYPDGSSA